MATRNPQTRGPAAPAHWNLHCDVLVLPTSSGQQNDLRAPAKPRFDSATLSHFIATRVAHMLARVFSYNVIAGRRENGVSDPTIPQEDLVVTRGVSQQTFNGVMQELEEKRIVEIAYRSLRILEIDRLRSFGQAG